MQKIPCVARQCNELFVTVFLFLLIISSHMNIKGHKIKNEVFFLIYLLPPLPAIQRHRDFLGSFVLGLKSTFIDSYSKIHFYHCFL